MRCMVNRVDSALRTNGPGGGWGGPVVHLLCEVGKSAECTVLAAARLKASGMAITGTAAGRTK